MKEWLVTVEEKVRREYVVRAKTEAAARADPHDNSIDVRELEILDWNVLSVKPND